MAEVVLTDASVTIGGTDLSDHVRSITLNYNSEPQDKTAMGDTTRERIGGLLDWSVSVEFNQDYAASEVDATLFSAVGTVVTFVGKPDSGAVASTNPSYTGSALLSSYQPVNGSVGDIHTTSISLEAAGALTRATS